MPLRRKIIPAQVRLSGVLYERWSIAVFLATPQGGQSRRTATQKSCRPWRWWRNFELTALRLAICLVLVSCAHFSSRRTYEGFARDGRTGRLYRLAKRTRASQKINSRSGSTVSVKYNPVLKKTGDRCLPSPTSESNLNGRLEGPRKKDPAAMNSPKHIRQRCRAMRCAP